MRDTYAPSIIHDASSAMSFQYHGVDFVGSPTTLPSIVVYDFALERIGKKGIRAAGLGFASRGLCREERSHNVVFPVVVVQSRA